MATKLSSEQTKIVESIKALIKTAEWSAFEEAALQLAAQSPEIIELFTEGLKPDEIGRIKVDKKALIAKLLKDENYNRASAGFCIMSATGKLDHLEMVNLSKFKGINLKLVSRLTKLKQLFLGSCSELVDITGIDKLKNLASLTFSECEVLQNIGPLADLKKLEDLSLYGCKALVDIGPLKSLSRLTDLNLSYCQTKDLKPLASMSRLSGLFLSNCVHITDLTPLAKLVTLTKLDLAKCKALSDIKPLSKLVNLIDVRLILCPEVRDFSPLDKLPKLPKANNSPFSI